MISADTHVHTSFSGDSAAPIESVVERAVELGLEKICFTEHMDLDYPKQYNVDFTFSVEEYFKKIEDIRRTYGKRIRIYTGIELGLVPELALHYKNLVKKYPFDFIIGSSHLVGSQDPYFKDMWEGIEEEAGYRAYFQTILDNLEVFDDFDTYGHIDYIVRYGPNQNREYTYKKYADILDRVLKKLLEKGKALEVNTGGYKYGLGQPNPQSDVLQRYKELGGELITIGSDAHAPEHLAYDFAKVRELLWDAGYRHYTIFEERKPVFLPL